MQQITRYRIHPPGRAPFALPKLPRKVVLVVLLWSGITTAAIGARALGQFAPRPANPFQEYADIFPGQPLSAVQSRPFVCFEENNNYYTGGENHLRCTFRPINETFSSIDLIIEHGWIIQTSFLLHDQDIHIGDISAWWQTNPVDAFPNHAFFWLSEHMVIARTTHADGRHSLFRLVWSVSLSKTAALH